MIVRAVGVMGFEYIIPSGIGNPAWSCSSPQLDSSTQGFGELESSGGVELSQCDAIKWNRYNPLQAAQAGFASPGRGLMVFEYIIRYSPRRRASPCLAEGFSPTARANTGLYSYSSYEPIRWVSVWRSSETVQRRSALLCWRSALRQRSGWMNDQRPTLHQTTTQRPCMSIVP